MAKSSCRVVEDEDVDVDNDVFVVTYQNGRYLCQHWEKAAMKKAMKKVSARLAKRHVFAGKTAHTSSGLAKGDLAKNKRGKVISKKASARASKNPWIAAVLAARKALHIGGFCAIKKGTPLYAKAKALFYKK
jgi:hypothetical protein